MRLSFDDGPGADTPALLDVLAEHGVAAMFFLVGNRIAGQEAIVQRMAHEGHAVGNHSWSHPDLSVLPAEEIREQLERTSEAIAAATGQRPSLFRPPMGRTGPLVEAVAQELGMRTVLWDTETYDWRDAGALDIAKAIRLAQPRAVILLHDGPSGRGDTVEGVRRALDTGT